MKMEFNELREKLNDLLKLENEPVAIKWTVNEPEKYQKEEGKSRFCSKLVTAMEGKTFYSTVEEEECMGGARYSAAVILSYEKNYSATPPSIRSN